MTFASPISSCLLVGTIVSLEKDGKQSTQMVLFSTHSLSLFELLFN